MTGAQLETLPAPETAVEPPVPVDAAERVLGYLVFHRSLIDDGAQADARRALLERYLALVRDLKEGVHIVIADPMQKATALLFELVMAESFDPWEIDLARFTQIYLERMRGEEKFDFAVSGRLVYMAWSILYLQSRDLLAQKERAAALDAGPVDPTALDAGLGDPLDDGLVAGITDPSQSPVTTAVLDGAGLPPLEEMIRHSESRPVSLLELVQAFGDAEAEARRSLHLEELRERLREQQRAPPEVLVHGDVPERDLADAWEVCRARPIGAGFSFLDLWRKTEGRDRLVALFLASLFLAKERVIELRQESVGASALEIVRLADARPVRGAAPAEG